MFSSAKSVISRKSARQFSTGLNEVVIVAYARTPIGSMSSSLAKVSAPELGSVAITGALKRANLNGSDVNEVIMGNVVSAGIGQAPARQAAIGAKLPESVICTTVNKVCSSGMKSVMYGAQSIALGHHNTVVAGGMESMSNVPYYSKDTRAGARLGHKTLIDGVIFDGLWDPYNNIHMGVCAEKTAKDFGITRADQDAYADRSYKLAAAAQAAGFFANEIEPVSIKAGKNVVTVSEDEEISKYNPTKAAALKPAFLPDGTITAANASKLNDGAAALVLMSAAEARARGLKPLARIRSYADHEAAPIDFSTAPATAGKIALQRAGLEAKDVQFFEFNEAFSSVILANQQLLGLKLDNINVNGGAVSLGHPIGSSGARIIGTLANILVQKDATFGLAGICNGGGGGSAVVIERLN